MQRGPRQRSAGERPLQQPLQAPGERAGVGAEQPDRPRSGDPGSGGEAVSAVCYLPLMVGYQNQKKSISFRIKSRRWKSNWTRKEVVWSCSTTASHGAEIRCRTLQMSIQISGSRWSLMVVWIAQSLCPAHSCHLSGPSQVDQLRSELMQERSARHDLEMDKSALERQVPQALWQRRHRRPFALTLSRAASR